MSRIFSASVPSAFTQRATTARPRPRLVVDGYAECECGRPKSSIFAGACQRCRYLDGTHRLTMAIVAELRVGRALTKRELIEATGSTERGVLRAVQKLKAEGRVREYWEEFEAPPVRRLWAQRAIGSGGTRSIEVDVAVTGGRWLYVLTESPAVSRG